MERSFKLMVDEIQDDVKPGRSLEYEAENSFDGFVACKSNSFNRSYLFIYCIVKFTNKFMQ